MAEAATWHTDTAFEPAKGMVTNKFLDQKGNQIPVKGSTCVRALVSLGMYARVCVCLSVSVVCVVISTTTLPWPMEYQPLPCHPGSIEVASTMIAERTVAKQL